MHSRFFSYFCLFAVLVFLGRGVAVSARIGHFPNEASDSKGQFSGRRLSAARPRSNIAARSIDTALRRDHELHYIDDSQAGQASLFAAQVTLSSKLPTLLLEELEYHIEEIECYDSSLRLRFSSADTVKIAHEELMKAEGFYVITSHEGCNDDGERDVHLVSTVLLKENFNTIVLSVIRMPWENIFHKMDVHFGDSEEIFEVRRHESLRKRQDTTSGMATTTSAGASMSSISIAFPTVTTSAPGTFNISDDISSELIDTQILPPPSDLDVDIPSLPEVVDMTVKCKNCSVQGTLSLFQGFFSMENTIDRAEDENMIREFFTEDGYVEFRADNVAAHIELESTVVPSVALGGIDILLPSIGLPGFTIPGVATVGPLFRPVIEIGAQLSAQINLTYGFDLTIPNNSSIIINVADLANSTESGFRDASVNPLPFQASIPSLALTLSIGFLPRLLLGIDVGSASGGVVRGNAGVGVVLGLPKVEAKISQVADVNERCEAVNATTGGDISDDIFDSLTLIEPSMIFDVALIAEAGISLVVSPIEFDVQYPFTNQTFPLPTSCLRFDDEAGGYAPAATAAATAAATGGDGGAGSGAVRLGMPGRLNVLGGLLVGVMGVFVVAA